MFFFNLRRKFFERTVEATTTDMDSPFGLGHICDSLSGTDRAKVQNFTCGTPQVGIPQVGTPQVGLFTAFLIFKPFCMTL